MRLNRGSWTDTWSVKLGSTGATSLLTVKTEKPGIRRRKTGAERRLQIAQVAAEMFAMQGFSVSTRAIADELDITQAALYKHFQSKDEIIEEVFRVRFLEDRQSDFKQKLGAVDGSFQDRLTQAYIEFSDEITEVSMKLFQRASYDGLDIAKQYSPHLDSRIVLPILECLRAEAKLPTLNRRKFVPDERELVLMLHSGIVFLNIRKYIYHIDFKAREPALIKLQVSTWLSGALVSIRKINSN